MKSKNNNHSLYYSYSMGPPLPRHEGDTSYVKYELKMGKNQIYAKNRFLGLFSGAFYVITQTRGDR